MQIELRPLDQIKPYPGNPVAVHYNIRICGLR